MMMRNRFAAWLLAAVAPTFAQAAPFEVGISPSRIETPGKPGGRIGHSINLMNLGNAMTEISVRTLDWSFSDEGQIVFHDELLPNSCRPWVTLERRFVRLVQRGRVSYRFQVQVPPEAKRGECRFMIAFEGVEPAHRAAISSGAANLNLPISGRVAVAVYVMIDGAQPRLEVRDLGLRIVGKSQLPYIEVTNAGDAHGRLEGSVEGLDAAGSRQELLVDSTPVLPGQTRRLVLQPRQEQASPVYQPKLPLKITGQLDWDMGSFKVERELR